MPEVIHQSDGRLEHPEVRFEPSDASATAIFYLLLGAIVIAAVIHVGVYAFFSRYKKHLDESLRSPFPLAADPSTALPRKPRLEQVDRMAGKTGGDIYLREAAKLKQLDSYGATESKGYVHVPIKRAMQWALEKQVLKARPQPPAKERQRSEGLFDAGESNSGRLLKGGKK